MARDRLYPVLALLFMPPRRPSSSLRGCWGVARRVVCAVGGGRRYFCGRGGAPPTPLPGCRTVSGGLRFRNPPCGLGGGGRNGRGDEKGGSEHVGTPFGG